MVPDRPPLPAGPAGWNFKEPADPGQDEGRRAARRHQLALTRGSSAAPRGRPAGPGAAAAQSLLLPRGGEAGQRRAADPRSAARGCSLACSRRLTAAAAVGPRLPWVGDNSPAAARRGRRGTSSRLRHPGLGGGKQREPVT